MPKKTFGANIQGTPGTTYDLDEIKADSRTNSAKSLVVQIWNYDPNSDDPTKRSPRPPELKTGQIWLAKRSGK